MLWPCIAAYFSTNDNLARQSRKVDVVISELFYWGRIPLAWLRSYAQEFLHHKSNIQEMILTGGVILCVRRGCGTWKQNANSIRSLCLIISSRGCWFSKYTKRMVRSKFRSHMRCELASGSSHDGHNDGFYKAIGINGMLQGKKFKKIWTSSFQCYTASWRHLLYHGICSSKKQCSYTELIFHLQKVHNSYPSASNS